MSCPRPTAGLLEISVPSANSLVQRARAGLRRSHKTSDGRLPKALRTPASFGGTSARTKTATLTRSSRSTCASACHRRNRPSAGPPPRRSSPEPSDLPVAGIGDSCQRTRTGGRPPSTTSAAPVIGYSGAVGRRAQPSRRAARRWEWESGLAPVWRSDLAPPGLPTRRCGGLTRPHSQAGGPLVRGVSRAGGRPRGEVQGGAVRGDPARPTA